jgi:hypothetical protein
MEVVRNIQLKLGVSEGDHKVQKDFDKTFKQFRQATKHVADHGWYHDPPKSRTQRTRSTA